MNRRPADIRRGTRAQYLLTRTAAQPRKDSYPEAERKLSVKSNSTMTNLRTPENASASAQARRGGAAKRLPSAEARTSSLFTGQTDVEQPEFARDGSRGQPPRKARSVQPKWHGLSLGYGDPEKPTYREVARISPTPQGHEARVRGVMVGTADTMTGAVSLCMTALARRESGRE